jgi:hypothetical protein
VIDLTPQECQRILNDGYIAHIGVMSESEPYVTPMSYVMVNGDLAFRTGPGKRVEALRSSPHCCVEITILREGGAWESVLFWGDARFVEDLNGRADIVAALLHKYHTESPLGSLSPSFLPAEHPIIAITPDRVTGRASGRDFTAKTRPGRL